MTMSFELLPQRRIYSVNEPIEQVFFGNAYRP